MRRYDSLTIHLTSVCSQPRAFVDLFQNLGNTTAHSMGIKKWWLIEVQSFHMSWNLSIYRVPWTCSITGISTGVQQGDPIQLTAVCNIVNGTVNRNPVYISSVAQSNKIYTYHTPFIHIYTIAYEFKTFYTEQTHVRTTLSHQRV